MIKKNLFLIFCLFASLPIFAQPVIKGPYTVKLVTENVFDIEDANESNPAGIVTVDDGQIVHMNNSSDMYLIRGFEKALLIDLSNDVKWDKTARDSLRSIVYNLIGKREFYITVTHKHGDHLGMLPVFKDDPRVKFWIPEDEFKGMGLFPEKRTTFFPQNASIDLGGGMIISSMELPGHTDHSTVFFLKTKNMLFTSEEMGNFTRISKTKDYGLTVTRLVVDLGEGAIITEKDLAKDAFKVVGFNKSNEVIRDIKKLSVTDGRGYDVESGSHVTIDLDFGFDADSANAFFLVVTLNKDLGKYSEGTIFIQHGRTLRR